MSNPSQKGDFVAAAWPGLAIAALICQRTWLVQDLTGFPNDDIRRQSRTEPGL